MKGNQTKLLPCQNIYGIINLEFFRKMIVWESK